MVLNQRSVPFKPMKWCFFSAYSSIFFQDTAYCPIVIDYFRIYTDRINKKCHRNISCPITVKISERNQKRNKYKRIIWKLIHEDIHLSCDFFHSIRFKVNKGWSKALLLFLCPYTPFFPYLDKFMR